MHWHSYGYITRIKTSPKRWERSYVKGWGAPAGGAGERGGGGKRKRKKDNRRIERQTKLSFAKLSSSFIYLLALE